MPTIFSADAKTAQKDILHTTLISILWWDSNSENLGTIVKNISLPLAPWLEFEHFRSTAYIYKSALRVHLFLNQPNLF